MTADQEAAVGLLRSACDELVGALAACSDAGLDPADALAALLPEDIPPEARALLAMLTTLGV